MQSSATAVEEMEMRADEEIGIGQDISPPLSPLAFSLYDSFLCSHCSSCFSPLSAAPPLSPAVLYCSAACSLSDFPLRLPQPPPDVSPLLPSDIRAALRFLCSLSASASSSSSTATASFAHRIGGLLTNHRRLMADPFISTAIRRAATVMASALRSRGNGLDRNDTVLEEAAICLVITNAVEVQGNTGRALGIAVYDAPFSWINHSCSPNACYGFVISPRNKASFQEDRCRPKIAPHMMNLEKGEVDVCSSTEYWEGRTSEHGPRVIVRSIKRIKKGEEITISYTDMLQPKTLRQSDLWSKYQFVCCCGRCAASTPAYIDSVLERVHSSQPSSDHETFFKDEATRSMTDSIEEAIDEFLSNGISSETCCETIEQVLNHGVQINHSQVHEAKFQLLFWLHPLHHAALNAYMTLASAYKIRSTELAAVDSETEGDKLKAFNMSRIGAAYCLFLAGATHHLFSSEPSVVVSAANFWTSAGESLLALVRGPLWGSPISSLPSIPEVKCTKCSLIHTLEALFSNASDRHRDFEDKSSKLLKCVTDISQEIWSFLACGCPYLQKFRTPANFSFQAKQVFESSSSFTDGDTRDSADDTGGSTSAQRVSILQLGTSDQRVSILQLGVHCLLFGALLADLCFGQNSHLVSHVRNVLYRDEDS